MENTLLLQGMGYAEDNYLNDDASHLIVDKQLIPTLMDLNGKRIIDFGCGMGGMTLWYASKWDCEIYGVDIDSHHINVAKELKRKHGVTNVQFEKRNIVDNPLEGKFDYIFLNDVVEHIREDYLVNIFQQLSKALTPDGGIFVSYPPWKSPYASHLNHVIKIPWVQFLPTSTVDKLIDKHNHPIVGDLESTLRESYEGLNHMTHKKLMGVIEQTSLKQAYRKSHTILNRVTPFKQTNFRIFPLNYLITKEFILLKNK